MLLRTRQIEEKKEIMTNFCKTWAAIVLFVRMMQTGWFTACFFCYYCHLLLLLLLLLLFLLLFFLFFSFLFCNGLYVYKDMVSGYSWCEVR